MGIGPRTGRLRIDERERERESFCVLELGELVRIPRVKNFEGVLFEGCFEWIGKRGLKVIREWL